jgi:hypothetical protein
VLIFVSPSHVIILFSLKPTIKRGGREERGRGEEGKKGREGRREGQRSLPQKALMNNSEQIFRARGIYSIGNGKMYFVFF